MNEMGGRMDVAIGRPPTELIDVDLADPDNELDEVLHASDNWVYEYDPSGTANWDRVSHLAYAQQTVQDWRGTQALPAHKQLGVHILNDLMAQGDGPRTACVLNTVGDIATTMYQG